MLVVTQFKSLTAISKDGDESTSEVSEFHSAFWESYLSSSEVVVVITCLWRIGKEEQ